MLGEAKEFLKLKDGSIALVTTSGYKRYYSYIEGRIEDISLEQRGFGENFFPYWDINIRDERGILFALELPALSPSFVSIILSLVSDTGLEAVRRGAPIQIKAYPYGSYTSADVYSDGDRILWGYDFPSDDDRLQFILSSVKEINKAARAAKIGKQIIK